MTPQALTIIVLLLLICAAATTLFFDGRQRRIERHLSIALSPAQAKDMPSIRRIRPQSNRQFMYRLFNYKDGITYYFPPEYSFLAAAIAAGVLFYIGSLLHLSPFITSPAAGAASIVVVRQSFGWQRHRIADRLLRQLPDTIEIVTSTVRSGLPVNEGFRVIAREMPEPTAGQFAIVCSELSLGRPLEEAVEGIYRRTDVPEYSFFAVTLAVQLKAGGSLAETLQTLADTVRQRVALAARAKALAGEVIFSSRALTLAPFLVGGVLHLINPQLTDLLFTDPTGQRLLAYAGASVLVGALVIRWMIKKDTAL